MLSGRCSVVQGYFPQGLPRLLAPSPVPVQGLQAAQPSAVPGKSTATVVQRHARGSAVQLSGPLARFGASVGQRLPEAVQRKMEALFQTSFADVRVHVGPQAPAVGALALAHGTDLYFAPGQYNPLLPHGQRLLAHELTHVVQQRSGRVRNPFGTGVALVQDCLLEAEADRMGLRAAQQPAAVQPRRGPVPRLGHRWPTPVVQRCKTCKNPLHTSKRWDLEEDDRPIELGGKLFIWRARKDSSAGTLLITAHGGHSPSKDGNVTVPSWVNEIEEMGTYGKPVRDFGLKEYKDHPDKTTGLKGGNTIANYTLSKYQYGHSEANETYKDVLQVARRDNIDVLTVRNRWWKDGGTITISEVFNILQTSNLKYSKLIFYFCFVVSPQEMGSQQAVEMEKQAMNRQGYGQLLDDDENPTNS